VVERGLLHAREVRRQRRAARFDQQ
jgi:hypothetical protein